MTEASFGFTKGGTPITDEMSQGCADEAERGYSSELLVTKRRGPGRPSLGNAAKTVGSVRLDPALGEEAARRAEDDGVSVSEIDRCALSVVRTQCGAHGGSATVRELVAQAWLRSATIELADALSVERDINHEKSTNGEEPAMQSGPRVRRSVADK